MKIKFTLSLMCMVLFSMLRINSVAQHVVWSYNYDAFNHANEIPQKPILLNNGDAYILGTVYNETVDLDPSSSSVMVSPILNATTLQRLDANGALMWSYVPSQVINNSAHSMGADDQGGVYVHGRFNDSIDFDPSSGTHMLHQAPNLTNSDYIVRLRADGSLAWAHSFGVGSMVMDVTEDGHVALMGWFGDSVDADPGVGVTSYSGSNFFFWGTEFLTILDSNGQYEWSAMFGSNSSFVRKDIQFDDEGNLYAMLTFTDGIDLELSAGPPVSITYSGEAIALIKFDVNGNLLWYKTVSRNDAAIYGELENIGNNIYIHGWTYADHDMDWGSSYIPTGISGTDPVGAVIAFDSNGDYHAHMAFEEFITGASFEEDGVYVHFTNVNAMDIDPGSAVVTINTTQNALARYDDDLDYVDYYLLGERSGIVRLKFDVLDHSTAFLTCAYGDSVSFELDSTYHVPSSSTDSVASVMLRMDLTSPLSTPEVLGLDEIGVYPNPTQDVFYTASPSGVRANRLMNLNGQTIYIYGTDDQYSVGEVPAGLYLVELSNGDIIKLMVRR